MHGVLIGAADDLVRPARCGAHSLCPARPELARLERPGQEARALSGSIGWSSACCCCIQKGEACQLITEPSLQDRQTRCRETLAMLPNKVVAHPSWASSATASRRRTMLMSLVPRRRAIAISSRPSTLLAPLCSSHWSGGTFRSSRNPGRRCPSQRAMGSYSYGVPCQQCGARKQKVMHHVAVHSDNHVAGRDASIRCALTSACLHTNCAVCKLMHKSSSRGLQGSSPHTGMAWRACIAGPGRIPYAVTGLTCAHGCR